MSDAVKKFAVTLRKTQNTVIEVEAASANAAIDEALRYSEEELDWSAISAEHNAVDVSKPK